MMHFLPIFTVLLLTLSGILSEDEVCDISGRDCENEDESSDEKPSRKYQEHENKWSSYLEKIEEAEKHHKPCQGCKECYEHVIKNDLSLFNNQIT